MMRIRFLQSARLELDEAIEYYNTESPGVGDAFLQEVLASLKRIGDYPEAWHPFSKRTRRCQTRRFPYGLIYQIRKARSSSWLWPTFTENRSTGRIVCSRHNF
jgi:plasmid stabilization system protein ParE